MLAECFTGCSSWLQNVALDLPVWDVSISCRLSASRGTAVGAKRLVRVLPRCPNAARTPMGVCMERTTVICHEMNQVLPSHKKAVMILEWPGIFLFEDGSSLPEVQL